MLLGVIPMICFEFLRILEKNRKNGKPGNLVKHGLLRRSVGNPHRDVALRDRAGDSNILYTENIGYIR